MSSKAKIFVSSNEPKPIILELQNTFDVDVMPLACGDILVPTPGNVLLIERKTPQDLLASIADGRLASQCARMVSSSNAPTIIIHGDIKVDKNRHVVADGRKTKWNYWSVIGSLLSVQLAGVLVAHVPEYLFVEAVQHIITWSAKEKHLTQRRVTLSLPTTFSKQVDFMSSIPGVGGEKANLLLHEFGSPLNALCRVDEWSIIKGIATMTVERISEFLNWSHKDVS